MLREQWSADGLMCPWLHPQHDTLSGSCGSHRKKEKKQLSSTGSLKGTNYTWQQLSIEACCCNLISHYVAPMPLTRPKAPQEMDFMYSGCIIFKGRGSSSWKQFHYEPKVWKLRVGGCEMQRNCDITFDPWNLGARNKEIQFTYFH